MSASYQDARALPHLIEAMQASSDRDPGLAREALIKALHECSRSSASSTISAALAECSYAKAEGREANVDVLWARAFAATRQLTYAEPPDVSTLPIPPALRGDDCPASECQAPSQISWSFCCMCGIPLPIAG